MSAGPQAPPAPPVADAPPVFGRVLVKLSGEALMGDREYGLDGKTVGILGAEIIGVRESGV